MTDIVLNSYLFNFASGSVIVGQLNSNQLSPSLESIGISIQLHRSVISDELSKLLAINSPARVDSAAPAPAAPTSVVAAAPAVQPPSQLSAEDIASLVEEKVTVAPRALMTDIFKIQGLPCVVNSNSPVPTDQLQKIYDVIVESKAACGHASTVCNGEDRFDCFLNYRVSADRDIAAALYEFLTLKGLCPFWDFKCLKAGLPWKEGFLTGGLLLINQYHLYRFPHKLMLFRIESESRFCSYC